MEPRKAEMTVCRPCKFGTMDIPEGGPFTVLVHAIGFKGGFERYPASDTMEGEIISAVTIEFLDGIHVGMLVTFELGYQVLLKML